MPRTKDEYLEAFWALLHKQDVTATSDSSKDKTKGSTRAYYYSTRESCPFGLSDVLFRGARQGQDLSERSAVVVENVDLDWVATLGCTWDIHPEFFARHAVNPAGSSSWQAIFGHSPSNQRKPTGSVRQALGEDASIRGRRGFHIDGVFEYCRHISESTPPSGTRDLNFFFRHVSYDLVYGWQVNTVISYHLVTSSLYLFLVDAPMARTVGASPTNMPLRTKLYLPLSENRGGLVVPQLFFRPQFSLFECLAAFFSHTWHFNTLCSNEDDVRAKQSLTPEAMLHFVAVSSWRTNLQSIKQNVERIAFTEIKTPGIHLNDELHNHRQDIANLRAEVIKTKKYMPLAVDDDPQDSSHGLGYVGFLGDVLGEILEEANTTEKVLMDTFQLLMSSISILDSQKSIEQNNRGQRLTQLAFIYIPLSFVTGVFGMNVREINGSQLSIWVCVVLLVVTAACTVLIFGAYKQWDKFQTRRTKQQSVAGG